MAGSRSKESREAEFWRNHRDSKNRGKKGFVQAEDGSWVPKSFYAKGTVGPRKVSAKAAPAKSSSARASAASSSSMRPSTPNRNLSLKKIVKARTRWSGFSGMGK